MKKTIVEVYKGRRGQFRWRAKARNGEIIASSEAYTRRDSARRGARRAFPKAEIRVVTQRR